MALEVSTAVNGRLLASAYVRVLRIVAVDKDAGSLRGDVGVYASSADRQAGRPPEQIFELALPYSDQPFAALYTALKQAYPTYKDI